MESFPWLFAVLGGAVILGIVIAYGSFRASKATRRQQEAGEHAAHEIYHKDQAKH